MTASEAPVSPLSSNHNFNSEAFIDSGEYRHTYESEQGPDEKLEPRTHTKTTLKKHVETLEIYLALSAFGIAGSMARNGLVQLLQFENLGSVWPNFTACFIIACIPSLTGPSLSLAISTGFCGAMSSFSELITDVFLQSTSPTPNWPKKGYGAPLFMARLLLEMSCCFTAYIAGTHLSVNWDGLPKVVNRPEKVVHRCWQLLGIAAWIICLIMSILCPSNRRWWPLSGVFAPFGVWLRYKLTVLNNPHRWFKWGTYTANVFSTLVACVLQTCVMLNQTTELQKQILLGLQRGFCGCLSTISTLVKELNTMPVRYGYCYGIISVFTGYAFAFIIIGSYKWTR